MQSLVPNSHLLDPISSQKVSKAAILKRCKKIIEIVYFLNEKYWVFGFLRCFFSLATDYLLQLNKEREELKEQLESHKKETYCLRAVQKYWNNMIRLIDFHSFFVFRLIRTYEDILEMNINSRRNASATIDEEHKFQMVRRFLPVNLNSWKFSWSSHFSFKISPILFFIVSIKPCNLHKWVIFLNSLRQFFVGSKILVAHR